MNHSTIGRVCANDNEQSSQLDLMVKLKNEQVALNSLLDDLNKLLTIKRCASTDDGFADDSSGSTGHDDDSSKSNQAAFPKRTRSLVEDARFDTLRNRELRRALWLESQQKLVGESTGEPDELPETGADATEQASDGQKQQQKASTLEANIASDADAHDQQAFPRHISELDQCNHLLIKYEPELDPTHPGFHDLEYRARRRQVAQIAFDYKHGQAIPRVDYHPKELETWKYIYLRLKEAYAKYACEQHNKAIERLERECGYSPNSIPQLEEVSNYLLKNTGWRLRPVAGLLSARDFLASLAFRVFQTTQYIRHWGNPEHSVEPDCIHELMGHIPMLLDPSFAQFSQELGLASLGATDEQIERFATLYWFTVEFGLCRERGQLKCYGAGLLSSFGEMEHALESGKPQLKEFVAEETATESYDDADYQVVYYVANSFDDAKQKIRDYATKHLERPNELVYEPYSCSIRQLDSLAELELLAGQIKNDILHLSSALGKLRLATQAAA